MVDDAKCAFEIQYAETGAYRNVDCLKYFGDLTEAYFGKNDFFPFNREDLKKYDPTGYRLMQDVWGQPRDGTAPSPKR